MRYTARRFCSNPGCLFRAAVQSRLRSVSSSRSDRPLIISRSVRVYNNVQSTSILLSSGAFESEQTERHYHGLANNNINVTLSAATGARRRRGSCTRSPLHQPLPLSPSSCTHPEEDSITDNR